MPTRSPRAWGRRAAQGWAASKAAAARRTAPSSLRRPTIWRPTGKPSAVRPQGTVQAGWPVRLKGKVKGVQPSRPTGRPATSVGPSMPSSKAGDRDRRRQQQVVPLEDAPHPVAIARCAGSPWRCIGRRRPRRAVQHRRQPRVEQRPAAPAAGRRPAPRPGKRIEHLDDLARVGEAWLRLLDDRAQVGEAPRRRLGQRPHLRVDRRVAEIGAPGDAPAGDAALAVGQVVDTVVGQREAVALVRAGHDVQHQRRVAHGAGHRAGGGQVVARSGIDRHAPVRGLVADDAAESGRDADASRRRRCRVASGPRPAATAAPAPPLEPPGVRSSRQGLRVGGKSRLSVAPFQPNSGVLVRPTTMAPEAAMRAPIGEVSRATLSRRRREP